MLDRNLIETMYKTASQSTLQSARPAAAICRQMLEMPLDSQMTFQFQEGERFTVTRRKEGYKLA